MAPGELVCTKHPCCIVSSAVLPGHSGSQRRNVLCYTFEVAAMRRIRGTTSGASMPILRAFRLATRLQL